MKLIYSIFLMARAEKPNVFKWLVFAWVGFHTVKGLRLVHGLVKARRLSKKRVSRALMNKYADL